MHRPIQLRLRLPNLLRSFGRITPLVLLDATMNLLGTALTLVLNPHPPHPPHQLLLLTHSGGEFELGGFELAHFLRGEDEVFLANVVVGGGEVNVGEGLEGDVEGFLGVKFGLGVFGCGELGFELADFGFCCADVSGCGGVRGAFGGLGGRTGEEGGDFGDGEGDDIAAAGDEVHVGWRLGGEVRSVSHCLRGRSGQRRRGSDVFNEMRTGERRVS